MKKKQKAQKAVSLTKETAIAKIDSHEVNPENLIAQAIKQGLPVETMEKLLAMRRELKAEWAREEYFKALSRFQKECPVIEKKAVVDYTSKRTGGRTKYAYARLEDIVSQVRDILERHGFSYSFQPGTDSITCCVYHSAGHSEKTSFPLIIDKDAMMNDNQKAGSANTYAKRYAFCNAFGIMTGDEDTDAITESDYKPLKQAKPVENLDQAVKYAQEIYRTCYSSGKFTSEELEDMKLGGADNKSNAGALHDLAMNWSAELKRRMK